MTHELEATKATSLTKPSQINFTGLEIPTGSLASEKSAKKPIPQYWARVQFSIPDGYNSAKAVEEWLSTNCPNEWAAYHYNNPKSKNTYERTMVVRFQNKDDAILFKLRGGHQAWEV